MILIVKYVKTDKIVIAAQLSKDADVAVAVIAVCRVQPVPSVQGGLAASGGAPVCKVNRVVPDLPVRGEEQAAWVPKVSREFVVMQVPRVSQAARVQEVQREILVLPVPSVPEVP